VPTPGELLILLYALWTVSVHITAFSGGGLRRACTVFGVTLLAAIAVGAWILRKRTTMGLARIGWWSSMSREQRAITALLLLAAMVTTAVAHRSHTDDTRFINWAVAAVDDPDMAIFHFDTSLALPGALINLDVRKVQSYEILGAALSWLTGLPAVWVFHQLLAVVAAPLIVLAFAVLFREIVPKRWLGALVGALLFLAVNGQTNLTHGNFAFVRLHHGKAVLVSVLLPMIMALAIRYARRPTPWTWALLSAAQIGAIGASSTGLWAAPVTAALGIVIGLPRGNPKRAMRRLLMGCAASAYIVGIGLYLRLAFLIPEYHLVLEQGAMKLFVTSAVEFFKSPVIAAATALLAAAAFGASRETLARRLCVVSTLGVFLLLANPLVAGVVARQLTSITTYWRVFWLLPLPVIAGLAVSTPLAARTFPGGRRGSCVAFTAVLAAVAAIWGPNHVYSADNRTAIRWPSLKVEAEYGVARTLQEGIGPGAAVIAPQELSRWLPMLHNHPRPLLALRRHARLHGDEGFRRLRLKDHVAGLHRLPGGVEELVREIRHYAADAVCLPDNNPWADEVRDVLGDLGYRPAAHLMSYEIWTHRPARPFDRHLE
jgi:hypothetical protein